MPDRPQNLIVDFYLGSSSDHRRRTIIDLWSMDYRELEDVHDYIQWLFPNWTGSQFSPDAPVLDEATRDIFHSSPEIRLRLMESLDVMLDFYGLARDEIEIFEAGHFVERQGAWLNPGNHNHLRITRIILCLWTLDFPDLARSLHRCLESIDRKHPGRITAETWNHWNEAARRQRGK